MPAKALDVRTLRAVARRFDSAARQTQRVWDEVTETQKTDSYDAAYVLGQKHALSKWSKLLNAEARAIDRKKKAGKR